MGLDLLVVLELSMSGLSGSRIAKRLRELDSRQSNETTRESETT
jgi:hypothetical protein